MPKPKNLCTIQCTNYWKALHQSLVIKNQFSMKVILTIIMISLGQNRLPKGLDTTYLQQLIFKVVNYVLLKPQQSVVKASKIKQNMKSQRCQNSKVIKITYNSWMHLLQMNSTSSLLSWLIVVLLKVYYRSVITYQSV